ncbi:MAG: putative HTH-type transcriptional regulator YxaF [Chloroflexota bacterium]|jgi:TetR/AcrR family transcriptional repressor of lmrAB and yxaGH operons
MASTREAFIETTARLLETQGYFATGLNQIVAESGAPKGSLYYYFPDGKEGLTVEVIERVSATIADHIRVNLAVTEDPAEAIDGFLRMMARAVEATNCQGGGPIATVALETSAVSERLRAACREAYRSWQGVFAEKLVAGGWRPEQATGLAGLIIAAIEGAIILCRTERSAVPLERVADELRPLLRG